MANKIVEVDLQATDKTGSMKKRVADAKTLNTELEKSKALTTGTKTGASAAYKAGAAEDMEYNKQRGAAGVTGAAGRDFANQAQGLGGVVRLYATYAANLFAVGAAYRALSEAQNTANMVQGLNQLGATSGVALGSLAKDFARASGGAISLRESMESTAKAMSSGMSQTQFLKLGEVAKKASQALGVNMSDAVSRLTRGITKLEPELLDELGIFTKVGKATEDYAKSVGKSASSLTDFERRQAFANAVLAEGAQKFSDIDIPTNPYDRLVASLKDVAVTGLNVINTVLVPITGMLASSPTALTALLAGLGTVLLKQALPAIGQYRRELEASAQHAVVVAQDKADTALNIEKKMYAEIKSAAENAADAEHAAMGRAEDALQKKQGSFRKSSVAYKILQKDVTEMSEKEIGYFSRRAALLEKQGRFDLSKNYRDTAAAIVLSKTAEEAYQKVVADTTKKLEARNNVLTARGRAEIMAKRASDVSASKGIISRSASDTEIIGISGAWNNVQKDLSDKKLGPIRSGFTKIASAATIATTAATSFIGALSTGLFVIGAVVAGLTLLYNWLQQNGKEVKAFNESLDSLANTTETAALTIKKFGTEISINAMIAQATTVDGLSNSMNSLINNLADADSAASGLDKLVDGFKNVADMGLKDEFAKKMPDAIKTALASIRDPKLKQEAEASLKSLFGTTSITKDLIEDLDPKDLVAGFKTFGRVIDEIGKKSISAVAPLTEIKTGFKELEEKYQGLKNTLANKDETSVFAQSIIKQSSKMEEAFKDSGNAAALLADILKDTSQIRMFPPEAQNSIIKAAQDMGKFQEAVAKATAELEIAEKKVQAGIFGEKSTNSPQVKEILVKMRVEAEGDVRAATTKLNAAVANVNKLTSGITTGLAAATSSAFKLMQQPLIAAISQAGISASKTAVGILEKTPETVREQTRLDIASINVQASQLKATYNLIAQLELSRLTTERVALEEKKAAFAAAGEIASAKAIGDQIAKVINRENTYKSQNISRDVRSGNIELNADNQDIIASRVGIDTQLAGLAGQARSTSIAGKATEAGTVIELWSKGIQEVLKSTEAAQLAYKQSAEYRSLSTDGVMSKDAELVSQIQSLRDLLDNADIYKRIEESKSVLRSGAATGLAANALEKGEAELKSAQDRQALTATANRQITDQKIALELTNKAIAAMEQQITITEDLRSIESERSDAVLEIDKRMLDYRLRLGEVTETEYNRIVEALDSTALAKEYDTKVTEINNKSMLEGIAISKAYVAAGYNMTAELEERSKVNENRTQAELDAASSVYNARLKEQSLMQEMTDRQKAYGDVFKTSFEGMADAIAEFAETGKLNFGDLINSMLADLLRYELRLNMMEIYKGFGGSKGIAGFVTGLFSGNSTTGNSGTSDAAFELDWNNSTATMMANGGAFDKGVQKFAKGGAFTNSIVDRPTLFNPGLMGEEGAEAIMPLKRTSNGALGIQASMGGGTNVQVSVINNSNSNAETKETTDSKGNRKIEVIIGEMVTGEITRTNSPIQNGLKRTFGTAPVLTRR